MKKQVKYLLPAQKIDMVGFPVKQALPTQRVGQVDPFLLLHHAQVKFNQDRPAKHQGVGPHPHRGFSPVTFVIEGEVHHRDSRGHDQVARGGEVQWMHAGMGIVHSERPTQELVESGGVQEFIQFWINSPSSAKMKGPTYQHLSSDVIPVVVSDDGAVKTKVVAGSWKGATGPAETQSELMITWSESTSGGQEVFEIPSGYHSMLYTIRGEVKIRGYGVVAAENLIVLDTDGTDLEVSAISDAQYILFAGRPLDEKVTQYGPYVMNTQTEILEAMRDYQMGKMGVLIEE